MSMFALSEDRRRRTYRSSASSFVMFGAAPPCFAKRLRRAIRLRSKRIGGAERDRTDDLKLAKLALSQLSYSPLISELAGRARRSLRPVRPASPSGYAGQSSLCFASEDWWARVELNHRPHAYQACALTT